MSLPDQMPGSSEKAPERPHELEDLRQPALTGLCLSGLAIAWVAVAALGNGGLWRLAPVPGLVALGSGLALALRGAPLRLRSAIFLLGLVGSLLLGAVWAPSPSWAYYGSVVVTVAGLLSGPASSFFWAGLLTAALAVTPLPSLSGALPAGALIWTTAAVSWLSSRNLYTALSWAMYSQTRAWETADEVQRRRQQLRATLDSLRNAHTVLARANAELEFARRDALAARQLKEQFAANISHELRTPLSLILGFTEIMSRTPEVYEGVLWDETLRRDIATVRRNAQHLSELVDDILELARIDATPLPIHREPLDVRDVIHESVEIAGQLLRDKTVSLEVECEEELPELLADRTRLRQTLLNLLANACRYTDEGTIRVGAKRAEGEVLVTVTDSGCGIPETELDHIFDEFYQLDSWRRPGDRGKGLGLAVAKHFVQLHGGRIWASSKLGEGSSFHFTLPLSPKEVSRLRWSPGQSAALARPVVIALDRSSTSGAYLGRHLDGYDVRPARDAGEAADLVRLLHPRAVVVDPATAESLQRFPLPLKVPVIACSLPDHRPLSDLTGFAACLTKPVSAERLVSVVLELAPRGNVLIVDDERGFVQFVRRSFQAVGQGERVHWAYDADEAMAIVERVEPSVVLLDVVLPGTDGIALAAAMRSRPSLSSVPIVVVSGAAVGEQSSTRPRAFTLTKDSGLGEEELLSLVRSALDALRPDYFAAAGTGATLIGAGTARPAS